MTRLAILITCHNRKDVTLKSLRALSLAALPASVEKTTFLVDDGSTDGTEAAVRTQYPSVRVIKGDGNLFWNAAMRLAWSRAAQERFDFYLWLNDDLPLLPDAIVRLLAEYEKHASTYSGKLILVGKSLCPDTGDVTYGGYAHAPGISRLSWRRLTKDEIFCDTMNGNCVLLPQRCVTDIGMLSGKYRHAFGDIDYGIRARRAGYVIIECAQHIGLQVQNFQLYSGARLSLSIKNVGRVFLDPKGVPIKEWWIFCRDNAGPLWLVNFATRYVKIFFRSKLFDIHST